MKCLDMKIGLPSSDNKTFWHTIGTVFVDDNFPSKRENGKPITFAIHHPKANGIIVSREEKKEPDK